MAKQLLDSLSPGFQALSAQFTNAGLDLAAILAAGPNGLKAHLEGLVAAAVTEAQRETAAALEKAAAEVATAQNALAQSQTARNQAEGTLSAVVAAAGVKVEAAATTEQIAKAIDDRIALRAGEELAKRGVGTFPSNTPEANPTKPGASLTLTLAAFKALSSEEKMKFSRAGGSIID